MIDLRECDKSRYFAPDNHTESKAAQTTLHCFYQGPYASTTATARTTPGKKCVSFLLWNFAIIWNYPLCLSVLKLVSDKYAKNAFSFK